ncbi:MAG TPA: amidohydrolase family protein [Candidatus Acidoferrales bacterium]|nr:amidohydrolase family protein [Candidatus Acidoferrales bacterium]
MKRILAFIVLMILVDVVGATSLVAQDLAIRNVRVIVGNGNVIAQGSIVARSGKLVSVAAGPPNAPGVPVIDAHGMTAVPGFIDAHHHLMGRNPDQWLKTEAVPRMQEFLDAGYTTVLAGLGPVPGVLQLKQEIDSGQLKGPRILASGGVSLSSLTPDQARAEVRRLAGLGIHFIGEEGLSNVPKPGEIEVLKAIVDESKKIGGVYVMVHAVSIPAMLASVDAGAPLLVHTPHFGWVSDEDAKRVSDAGVKELSTIAFGAPVFGVFADDNVPRFRDGRPWPASIPAGEGQGREAGYKAVNARTLWDAGVVYGFGTDTDYLPKAGLSHELRSLNLMFSSQDIIKLMGPNTAAFIQMSDQVGTLEVGKYADFVIVDGDPLKGYWNLLNTRLVVKGGVIVSDQRKSPAAAQDY